MRLKHLTLVVVLTFLSTMGLAGVGLGTQEIDSPALRWKPDDVFLRTLSTRFQGFEFIKQLNLTGSVAVVAIPMSKSPVADFKDLGVQPVTIGGLYVPTGSLRLRLEPGAYRVELSRFSDSDKWRVRFVDEKGNIRGEAPAEVKPASEVAVPFATVEHSVCYRFDGTAVCI